MIIEMLKTIIYRDMISGKLNLSRLILKFTKTKIRDKKTLKHKVNIENGKSSRTIARSLHIEKVVKALDTGNIVIGVYLDIKKAFDAIDHALLLRKLYALGIRRNPHAWIKSYVTNRSKIVVYNNSKSETKFITHGVPQGSILGPLFLLC